MLLGFDLFLTVDAISGVGIVEKAATGAGYRLCFRQRRTACLADHGTQFVWRAAVGTDDMLWTWANAAPRADCAAVEFHCVPNLIPQLDAAYVASDIVQLIDDIPRIEQRE